MQPVKNPQHYIDSEQQTAERSLDSRRQKNIYIKERVQNEVIFTGC